MAGKRIVGLMMAGVMLSASSLAHASWIVSSEFSQTAVTPADFQSSTISSVDTNSANETFASRGFNVTSVPFDGSVSVSTDLAFTSSHVAVGKIRFDSDDNLNLLVLNYRGAGSILRSGNGSFSQYIEFDLSQSFPRSFAFDSVGNLIVGGTYGNINDAGWIRRYDATGSLLAAFDTPESPVGLAFDSAGQAYMASFDGQLSKVSDDGLSLVAELPGAWVGSGVGYVESFAVNDADGFFLGVNLGQRFGQNSGAILRLSETNEVDVLALGLGELPVDLSFGPNHDLYVASYNPYGSKVVRLSGDFSGDIGGVTAQSVPEPTTLVLFGLGLVALAVLRRRKP